MLDRENAFYEAHQAEFREKYFDKWLVIIGESLWGVYDKVSDAAKAALEHFESEEFIHRPADDGMVIEVGPFISVSRPDGSQNVKPESIAVSKGTLVTFPYAY